MAKHDLVDSYPLIDAYRTAIKLIYPSINIIIYETSYNLPGSYHCELKLFISSKLDRCIRHSNLLYIINYSEAYKKPNSCKISKFRYKKPYHVFSPPYGEEITYLDKEWFVFNSHKAVDLLQEAIQTNLDFINYLDSLE